MTATSIPKSSKNEKSELSSSEIKYPLAFRDPSIIDDFGGIKVTFIKFMTRLINSIMATSAFNIKITE